MSSSCRRDAHARRSVSSAADRCPTCARGGQSGARAPGGSAGIAGPELGIRSGPVCSSHPNIDVRLESIARTASHCQSSSRRRTQLLSRQDMEARERVHCRAIAPPAIAIAITFKVRVGRTWTGTEQDTYHRPDYKVPRSQHVQLDPISTDEMDHGWPHRENAALRRPPATAHIHTRVYSGSATSVRAVNESASPANVRRARDRICDGASTGVGDDLNEFARNE